MVFYLIYFVMWGYGASHDHCTCRLGMELLISILYVMLMITNYVTSYMKQNLTYGLLSYLLGYVELWGFT